MFKSSSIFISVFIRFLLVLGLLVTIVYLLTNKLYFTSILLVLITLLVFIESLYSVQRYFSFYDKTLTAILNNDFSADFSKIKKKNSYASLLSVYEKLKNNQEEILSKEIIYNTILNEVDTGILILNKTENNWKVNLLNNYLATYLEIPKVTKWTYLKRLAPKLCEVVENANFKEFKTTVEIQVKKQEKQTFVMQISNTKIYNNEFVIILLESVQKLVEKKEKEAWVNLMKVISHELLNSLTPIQSLSQNMYETLENSIVLSNEDFNDIKQSAYTMVNRSNHLQQFVEGYRTLAMLPIPEKKSVSLKKIIANCVNTMQPVFKKENIKINNNFTDDYVLFVDEKQLEQVLINLLTNSVYALENTAKKTIIISSELKGSRFQIHISDNGKGIEKEIQDKIFLPFFTTRKEGGGIGLTLSKGIVEAHNGYLLYNCENGFTTFTITFIQ